MQRQTDYLSSFARDDDAPAAACLESGDFDIIFFSVTKD